MNNIIHSVVIRKDGQEFACLIDTQDPEDALKSALNEAEGYSEKDCEVLRVVLDSGAALPIGFFWKKVVWLDDWGPTISPEETFDQLWRDVDPNS
jgi:hypothetical protein